jgi:hypothetical protein
MSDSKTPAPPSQGETLWLTSIGGLSSPLTASYPFSWRDLRGLIDELKKK